MTTNKKQTKKTAKAEVPAPKKPFIRWTQEELIKMADYVFEELLIDPSGNYLTIINKSMRYCLPPARHRTITGLPHAKGISELVKARFSKLANERGEHRKLEADYQNLKEKYDQLENDRISIDEVGDWISDEDVLKRAGEMSSDILEHLPLEKVVGFAVERLTVNLLTSGLKPIPTKDFKEPMDVRKTAAGLRKFGMEDAIKPVVRVYGAKADQTIHLRKKHPEINLITDDCEKSRPQLGKADLVIVWSNYIDHSNEDAIFNHYPREIIQRVTGGLSSINVTINEFFK